MLQGFGFGSGQRPCNLASSGAMPLPQASSEPTRLGGCWASQVVLRHTSRTLHPEEPAGLSVDRPPSSSPCAPRRPALLRRPSSAANGKTAESGWVGRRRQRFQLSWSGTGRQTLKDDRQGPDRARCFFGRSVAEAGTDSLFAVRWDRLDARLAMISALQHSNVCSR